MSRFKWVRANHAILDRSMDGTVLSCFTTIELPKVKTPIVTNDLKLFALCSKTWHVGFTPEIK